MISRHMMNVAADAGKTALSYINYALLANKLVLRMISAVSVLIILIAYLCIADL